MFAKKNTRSFLIFFRMIAVLSLVLTNFAGVFPVGTVHAQSTTISIRDDAIGGDCPNIGEWNPLDKSCVLNTDVNGISISIDSNNVILDGASHVLTGDGLASSYGVSVNNHTGVALRNLIITNYDVGIYVSYANNTLIENTTSHHNKHTGIQVSYSSQSLLRNNVVYGHPGTNVGKGINLSGGGQNILENNIIRDNSEGLRTGYTSYNIIRNNTFSGQSSYPGGGIMLYSGSHYNALTGNDFVNNYWGIDIHDSSNQNTIEGNSFSNNSKAIEVTWSVHNLISVNTMSNNNTGIDLGVRAGENTVRGNLINAGSFGIRLGSSGWPATNGSYSNVVTENTVSGASFANIQIDRTNNNQIYRNNFIGSTAHNNDGIGTTFDAGPELGGNYWTAYDTPLEGCINTNGDAYCDSPYLLEAGYQDHYPWARQDGWLNQPPLAEAGGPYTGIVGETITLDASASADPDGDPLTYEWDLDNDGAYGDATGVTPSTSFNHIGEHVIGLRVTDAEGLNDTDTAIVTVTDSTPPDINPTVNGTLGINNWYISDVFVNWNVNDPESGIASSNGCDVSMFTTDIMNTTLTCLSTNGAGLSNSVSLALKIDKTSPTIVASRTTEPNLTGWYKDDVIVQFACEDDTSGIPAGACPAGQTLSDEGSAIMSTPQTVVDASGNTSDNSNIVTVSIDKTLPVIAWTGDIQDGNNFYFGFVPPEPTCTAFDDLSGMDGVCTVSGYASTTGIHTLTATAGDRAGNIATETRSYTVLPWTLNGFYQPVDMNNVYNLVKGGSTVPFKFEIVANTSELTDTAHIKSLTYAQTSCDIIAITDEIETTTTGGTSLRYDATAGQFIYNWKTPGTVGKCYRVTLTTMDGSSLVAFFKLK